MRSSRGVRASRSASSTEIIWFFAWLIRCTADGGRQLALVEVQLAHRLAHEGEPVVLVVDDEAGGQPQAGRVLAQNAHARRVEGGDEGRPQAEREDEIFHPPPHLLRRLVGERDREHVARVHALDGEEIGDAMRDDARLAASRAGEDEQWSLRRGHGIPLRVIERSEKGVADRGGRRHGFLRYHSGAGGFRARARASRAGRRCWRRAACCSRSCSAGTRRSWSGTCSARRPRCSACGRTPGWCR